MWQKGLCQHGELGSNGPDRPKGLSLRASCPVPPTEVGGMISDPEAADVQSAGLLQHLHLRWIVFVAYALALGFVVLAPSAHAQASVTVDSTIEPARATIGDHLTLTVVARHPAAMELIAPEERGDFLPLELVEVRPPETRDVGDGLQETRLVYLLAAFETGSVQPQPLELTADGGSQVVATVQPPAVVIESVLPAGAPAQLRDVKGPLEAGDGPPAWLWATLVMAGFVALSLVTMALARLPVRRPPLPLTPRRVEAPDEGARRELDAIADAGLLRRDELKEYYGRIATCLRQYLSRRFDIPAVAMTPPELGGRLEELEVDRWPVRLAVNLLQQCEAVQFGQYQPARDRAAADLSAAYEVVDLTRRQEAAPQATEGAAASS